jgi:hypothetical protein
VDCPVIYRKRAILQSIFRCELNFMRECSQKRGQRGEKIRFALNATQTNIHQSPMLFQPGRRLPFLLDGASENVSLKST